MSVTAESAAEIPLLVSRAAVGDYARLARQVEALAGGFHGQVMYWSILCNEPLGRALEQGPMACLSRRLPRVRPRDLPSGLRRHPQARRAGGRVEDAALSGAAPRSRRGRRPPGSGREPHRPSPRRCRRAASSSCPAWDARSASTAASATSCPGSSTVAAASTPRACARSLHPPSPSAELAPRRLIEVAPLAGYCGSTSSPPHDSGATSSSVSENVH